VVFEGAEILPLCPAGSAGSGTARIVRQVLGKPVPFHYTHRPSAGHAGGPACAWTAAGCRTARDQRAAQL